MTIPTSGPISLGTIQGEYGGSNPISISEYYRGGSRVPNTGPNANIPTSGLIRMSNFYGGVAYIPDLVIDPIDWGNGSGTEYYQGVVSFQWPDKTVSGLSEPITLRFSTTNHYISANISRAHNPNFTPDAETEYTPFNSSTGFSIDVIRGGSYVGGEWWGDSLGTQGTLYQSFERDIVVQNGDIIRLSVSVSVEAGFQGTTQAGAGANVQVRNVSSGNTLIDEFMYSLYCENRF